MEKYVSTKPSIQSHPVSKRSTKRGAGTTRRRAGSKTRKHVEKSQTSGGEQAVTADLQPQTRDRRVPYTFGQSISRKPKSSGLPERGEFAHEAGEGGERRGTGAHAHTVLAIKRPAIKVTTLRKTDPIPYPNTQIETVAYIAEVDLTGSSTNPLRRLVFIAKVIVIILFSLLLAYILLPHAVL